MQAFDHKKRHQYDDIIDLPHHVSKTRPQMPIADRAAQFAPFAALSGHGEAVKETARLTRQRIELDETLKAALDQKLNRVRSELEAGEQPEVSVVYFVPDERKAGGAYEEASGCVRGIDEYRRELTFTDGTRIPVREIIGIESQDIVVFP